MNEGIYYLKATRSGVTYYFRHTLSGEKVTYTTPYSLYTTEDKSAAKLVEVVKQDSGGYTLEYPYSGGTARIYVYDVNSDGTIHTGANAKNVEANHHFQWDGYNGLFYQMEGSVKYVLAVKELENSNTGDNQIRMQAVPESELSDTVVAVELEAHPTHTVDTWVETTPATTTTTGVKTGTCTVCEREVTEEIPVLIPSISGYSISLKDNFAINFFVKTADFEDGYYTDPYMVFTMQEQETTVTAWSTATEDGTKTYSKQVADAFGAEYMVTAISGRGVVMNNSNDGAPWFPDIYPELDIYNLPGTAYDFALQPDVIVINLGTNDATNSTLNIDTFQAGVVSFINLVREKNPNAQIIWAYGLRSDTKTTEVAAAIEAAVTQVNTAGDSKVYYLPLDLVPSAQTDLNHPLAAGYTASGEKLIAKITEITGWK